MRVDQILLKNITEVPGEDHMVVDLKALTMVRVTVSMRGQVANFLKPRRNHWTAYSNVKEKA